MEDLMRLLLIAWGMIGLGTVADDEPVKDTDLLRAVTLYASFDDKIEADIGADSTGRVGVKMEWDY